MLRALIRNVSLNFIAPSLTASASETKGPKEGNTDDATREENKKSSGDASMPARTFLKNWLAQHRDYKLEAHTGASSNDEGVKLEKCLMIVPFELGEFHFFIEDFAEAERLFILARDRAGSFFSRHPAIEPKKWYRLNWHMAYAFHLIPD